MPEPARGRDGGRDLCGRPADQYAEGRHQQGAPEDGHGVPAVQSVPAPDDHGQYHAGTRSAEKNDKGASRQDRERAPKARQSGGQGTGLPGTALRRTETARRDRAGACHEPGDHAV